VFVSPVEITSVPASKACITQFYVIEGFCTESENKGSRRGALALRIYKILAGVPNLLFPMYHFSIPTHEHVLLQHFDRRTMNIYPYNLVWQNILSWLFIDIFNNMCITFCVEFNVNKVYISQANFFVAVAACILHCI